MWIQTPQRLKRLSLYVFLTWGVSLTSVAPLLWVGQMLSGLLDSAEGGEAVAGGLKAVGLVGSHPLLLALGAEAMAIAPHVGLPVMVLGPSGSGKEGVAKLIHRASGRGGAFVAVSCANLRGDLAESLLFGAERGAFTGATRRQLGLFEQAKGGTLFLDEVGELDLDLQRRLLRALQERVIRRVGGERDIGVDVRIVSATWRDIRELVRRGDVREDLFYRLAGHILEVPPLDKRGADVLEIARHCLRTDDICQSGGPLTLTPDGDAFLLDNSWPGNVRELIGVLRGAAIFANGGVINSALLSCIAARRGFGDILGADVGARCVLAPLPLDLSEPGDVSGPWLSTAEFAAKAGIHPRAARKAARRAVAGHTWRGRRLKVREVRGGRGSGRGGIHYEICGQGIAPVDG